MTVLSALLVTAAVVAAAASARVHGAGRAALRELRDGERRLEPGAGPGRRLVDELRWYGDVAGAVRDTGWRTAAVAVGLLAAGGLVLGVWILTSTDGLGAASVVVVLAGFALLLALVVVDGRRAEARLGTAVRHSALGPVRRLEDALAAVHAASVRVRATHRAWLRTRAAAHPLASLAAGIRERSYDRAVRRQDRALAGLRRAVPVDLAGIAVRPPAGYPEGLRGLGMLVGGGVADDDRWAAAVADLGRVAELDEPRRTRWLSALAACAELRDDPPARESAARWALDAAALGEPAAAAGDPLPDTVAIEPARPATWEGALHRARAVGAAPALLAEVTLRWAYALVAARSPLDPAVAAAVDLAAHLDRPDADRYLTPVRAGLVRLGATGDHLAVLVPPWTPRESPTTRPDAPGTGSDRPGRPGTPEADASNGPDSPSGPADAPRPGATAAGPPQSSRSRGAPPEPPQSSRNRGASPEPPQSRNDPGTPPEPPAPDPTWAEPPGPSSGRAADRPGPWGATAADVPRPRPGTDPP